MQQVGGLILAGGLGSRMGYCNKALVPYFTGRLVEPAIYVLKSSCQQVIVSANVEQSSYNHWSITAYADDAKWQDCGPLAGIITCLPKFHPDIQYIQILPCDAPLIPKIVIERLHDALIQPNVAAVYAQTTSQSHPVVCQFKREYGATLQKYLQQSGKHSIRKWLAELAAQPVWFEQEVWFTNVNDPQTLQLLHENIEE